jgi:hypothetical protein
MRLRAPLDEMIVTWPFGATSDDPRLAGVVHRGVDLRAVVGTPVYAAADGAAVALSQYGVGFGHYMRLGLGTVMLDGWDGSQITGDVVVYYAHLSHMTTNRPVTRGELIGWTGDTGYCLGAHLHWEVRVDMVSVDPMLYVEGGPMERLEQVGELATAVRWQLEEAQREREQAADLRAQAERLEQSAAMRLERLVSPESGLAYGVEAALGLPVPKEWGASE